MTTPITGTNPPFKNIIDTHENNNIKNNKNNPDKIIETVLLKIILLPPNVIFENHNIKTLGMPNNFQSFHY